MREVSGKKSSRIESVSGAIKGGALVVYPTETFYALGASLFHSRALSRVFSVKGRDSSKPLPFIASSISQALGMLEDESETILRLAVSFWPGPLTIVGRASSIVPVSACALDKTIAIRVSAHPAARALARFSGSPVTATSANFSGDPPARSLADMPSRLLNLVDRVLDGGLLPGGLPSTIVRMEGSSLHVLREGAVPSVALSRVVPLF